jgi:hypothetical protein
MNAKANIDIPPEIIDRLRAVGETSATALWDCHNNWIIKHKALEKIAAHAGITYSDCTVYPPQQGQDFFAVSVIGHMNDRSEWSIGEASPKNSKNNYYYAMAEKRAKDRVILKLLGLHAYVYSEEEADEFKEAAPVSEDHLRLAEHYSAVREYWDTIATMKIAHRDGDASQFAEAWIDLPNDQVKEALWVAPSKGGIFTTEERAYLKSNEVNEARKQLIKGEGNE